MTTGQDRRPLRFATFLAPNLLPVYRFIAEQISNRSAVEQRVSETDATTH
jgi:hypothetical protein